MALRVKEAHSFDHNGVPTTMRVGSLVADDDPRVKGREMFYEPAETAAARETGPLSETATAAPGERRSRRLRETETAG